MGLNAVVYTYLVCASQEDFAWYVKGARICVVCQ